jgi:anti-sigma regulatory factor (Ser/Thr protein kinase)
MATVEVRFTPLPAHVRTARLVATAVARRSGVDESLLDEVRLAVGEACSRAVESHRLHCPAEPIRVALTDDGERFEVVVTDAAPADVTITDAVSGAPPASVVTGTVVTGTAVTGTAVTGGGAVGSALVVDGVVQQLPAGVGLAVIVGLADDVRIVPSGGGTSIAMSWKRRAR